MVVDHDRLNVTVTMRSSDVAKVLPQDVAMTWFLLRDVAQMSNLDRGKMTFNIGNAHVYYEDCEWQEEFTIDGLD
jgi:thymidylate synthase